MATTFGIHSVSYRLNKENQKSITGKPQYLAVNFTNIEDARKYLRDYVCRLEKNKKTFTYKFTHRGHRLVVQYSNPKRIAEKQLCINIISL